MYAMVSYAVKYVNIDFEPSRLRFTHYKDKVQFIYLQFIGIQLLGNTLHFDVQEK